MGQTWDDFSGFLRYTVIMRDGYGKTRRVFFCPAGPQSLSRGRLFFPIFTIPKTHAYNVTRAMDAPKRADCKKPALRPAARPKPETQSKGE